jgi:hypothetical protein
MWYTQRNTYVNKRLEEIHTDYQGNGLNRLTKRHF